MIKQHEGKWCVFSKDGSKNLGCGDTKEWAERRLKQVEFFKRQAETLPEGDEVRLLLEDDEVVFEMADAYVEMENAPVLFEDGEVTVLGDFPSDTPGTPPPGYNLPKNWTPASAAKYWSSIGGSVTACMAKLGGERAAAFCASMKDYVTGTTKWRHGRKKTLEEEEPIFIHTSPIKFAEYQTGSEKWTDLLMAGDYVSMTGDPVSISDSDIDAYAKNFEAGVRGQDIPITFDHPEQGGVAGGWIKKVRTVVRDGKKLLQGLIDWTPVGREKVENKEYRYISSELIDGAKQLRAASLVNFPAIKGMNPVELGEAVGQHIFLKSKQMLGGTKQMPNSTISAEDQELIAHLAEAIVNQVETLMTEQTSNEDASDEETEGDEKPERDRGSAIMLTEGLIAEQVKPLVEQNKAMAKRLQEASEQVAQLMEERRLLKLRERISKVANLGPNKAYSPKVTKLLEAAALASPDEYENRVFDLIEALRGSDAVIDLSEKGSSKASDGVPEPNTTEFTEEVDKLARKLMSEQKIGYKDAAKRATIQLMEKRGGA